MAGRDPVKTAIAIAFIVVGVLLIIGEFALESLLPFAGVVLIVFGVLVALKKVPGGPLIAAAAIAVGAILAFGFLDLPRGVHDALDPVLRLVNILAGAFLLVIGAMQLSRR